MSEPPRGAHHGRDTSERDGPTTSTWSFVKWSLIALTAVVTLGVLVARLFHSLGIE